MNGLKVMRAELGLTQSELAAALHVSFTAVNRWENGRAHPNMAAYTLLLDYARAHGVSASCMEMMQNSFEITRPRRNGDQVRVKGAPPVDRDLLCQLVEEAETAIYVTDAATDELLYANRALEEAIGRSREEMAGCKCYEYLSRRDTPCPYCHKKQLRRDCFLETTVESAFNGRLYTARAKVISWNGRTAHVRYVTGIRNEHILQHLACGVCIYIVNADHTLDIRYANAGYYSLCEGTPEELAEAYRRDHLFGVCEEYRDRVRDFFVRVAETRETGEITYRCRSLKGRIKWVTACASYAGGELAVKDRIYCTFFETGEGAQAPASGGAEE